MKILLDTHVYLWALSAPEKIQQPSLDLIASPAHQVYVSSISIAEICIKASIGKLSVHFDPVAMIYESGFEALAYSPEDALLLQELPFHHRDPFDRMLIAQSIKRNVYLMSSDAIFASYNCHLLRC